MGSRIHAYVLAMASAGLLALTACSSGGPNATDPITDPLPAPASVTVASTFTEGLVSPWGMAFAADGTTLISERDTGRVWLLDATGGRTELGVVPDVRAEGEGGLLGLAVSPDLPDQVYIYLTTERDNRVIRMTWAPSGLGEVEPILTGIPRSSIHNGGRIAFGPDGMLYIATGDAGDPSLSQDRDSLGGKVLRLTPDGAIPADNPFPDSPVFTLGHRNVQGLAFDDAGRAWASEFGTSEADELNILEPGGNYGWPLYEGVTDAPGFINPVATWSPTSLASPSGIAYVGGESPAIYVAALRGQVLWQVPVADDRVGEPVALDLGDIGRLRTVEAVSDSTLWLMTSNTDGRGDPRPEDDRVLVLELDG